MLAGPGAQNQPKPAHRLLVIAVDGLDARFLNDPSLHVKAPNIRKLMRMGASASVVGVAPSDTRPSLHSMLTGLPPDEHGEYFWQADSHETPKHDALKQEALKIGSVYWPIEGDAGPAELVVDFPPPTAAISGNSVPFANVALKSMPAGTADRVESMFPSFQRQVWDDSSCAQAAAWILASSPPEILLVQFTDLANEQRQTPGLSVYARDSLENEDDLVGQILSKAPKDTIVAIVSGHGVENENYIVRPRVLLGKNAKPDSVEVADGLIGATDSATAGRLRALMKDRRHGIAREAPMTEVRQKAPSLGAWVAAFDTPPNYVAKAEDRGPALGPGSHLGIGGQWPMRPGYRSVFIVAGEGVHAKKLGEIDLLQIAPTLADIAGMPLRNAKKASLWPAVIK